MALGRGHTIPRMELCAAVMAIDLADIIMEQLDIDFDSIRYFTDSRIVLGYISNETCRFYVYVQNRVNRIRAASSPSQWNFISTSRNPADLATRPIHGSEFQNSIWLTGIDLSDDEIVGPSHPLIDPQHDEDVRPDVTCIKIVASGTSVMQNNLGSNRFSRFSTFVARLKRFLRRRTNPNADPPNASELYRDAENVIIRNVQREEFHDTIECIREGVPLERGDSLIPLSPMLDSDGLLRVQPRPV